LLSLFGSSSSGLLSLFLFIRSGFLSLLQLTI
jgi:hypothetical protein